MHSKPWDADRLRSGLCRGGVGGRPSQIHAGLAPQAAAVFARAVGLSFALASAESAADGYSGTIHSRFITVSRFDHGPSTRLTG
jgi:hypothetical protein